MQPIDLPKQYVLDALYLDPPEMLIDVGCGDGAFLELAARTLPLQVVYGVDVSKPLRMLAFARLSSLTIPSFSDAFVDVRVAAEMPSDWLSQATVVTCFETIEHVGDVQTFLTTLPHNVPTWFSTPNVDRWWVKLTKYYEPWDSPPNHLRRFSREALHADLMRAGFQNVSVITMPVRWDDLLKVPASFLNYKLGRVQNSARYEEAYGGGGLLGKLFWAAQYLLSPVTRLMAWWLNRCGYQGGNLLAYGIKRQS